MNKILFFSVLLILTVHINHAAKKDFNSDSALNSPAQSPAPSPKEIRRISSYKKMSIFNTHGATIEVPRLPRKSLILPITDEPIYVEMLADQGEETTTTQIKSVKKSPIHTSSDSDSVLSTSSHVPPVPHRPVSTFLEPIYNTPMIHVRPRSASELTELEKNSIHYHEIPGKDATPPAVNMNSHPKATHIEKNIYARETARAEWEKNKKIGKQIEKNLELADKKLQHKHEELKRLHPHHSQAKESKLPTSRPCFLRGMKSSKIMPM